MRGFGYTIIAVGLVGLTALWRGGWSMIWRAGAVCGAVLVCALLTSGTQARDVRLSDDEVREQIIADSIAQYPGNCACPYSTMRNGRRCGGRSAYSKPGGRAPICYADDVTDAMVARWRRR